MFRSQLQFNFLSVPLFMLLIFAGDESRDMIEIFNSKESLKVFRLFQLHRAPYQQVTLNIDEEKAGKEKLDYSVLHMQAGEKLLVANWNITHGEGTSQNCCFATNSIISYSDQPFYWANKFCSDQGRAAEKTSKTWIKINKPKNVCCKNLNRNIDSAQACCLFIMIG